MKGVHVLLFCALALHTVVTADDINTESAEQINNITCDISGTIHVHMKAGSWVKDVSTNCGDSSNVAKSYPDFTITGCSKDKGAILMMSEEPINKATNITGKKLQTKIVTCSSISTPVTRIPILDIGEKTVANASPQSVTETIKLRMELFSTDDLLASEAKMVTIGTQYTLRISGAGNHSMHVKSCDVSANGNFGAPVSVYTADSTSADSVLQPFNTSTAANGSVSLRSTLTGFRLIGSTTVYLRCTVTVCPSPTPCTSRKRKGRKHQPTEREALLRFQVRDSTMRASGINGSEKTAINNTMTLLVLFIARYFGN